MKLKINNLAENYLSFENIMEEVVTVSELVNVPDATNEKEDSMHSSINKICGFLVTHTKDRKTNTEAKASLLNKDSSFLDQIKVLDLSMSQIKELPEEIGLLRNLTNLNLSVNKLTTLPASISQLTSLRNLNLDGNQFREIPPQLNTSTLRILRIYGNPIETIPNSLKYIVVALPYGARWSKEKTAVFTSPLISRENCT